MIRMLYRDLVDSIFEGQPQLLLEMLMICEPLVKLHPQQPEKIFLDSSLVSRTFSVSVIISSVLFFDAARGYYLKFFDIF